MPSTVYESCLQLAHRNYSNCYDCCKTYTDYKKKADKANAPMPWIGLYVAAASLFCSLAMAADVYLGFRNKRLWFPCKYFTLNAVFLTLLAVAMKLPMDLNTDMPDLPDQLAKVSSSVFICTAMSNFMPSLGQMNNKEIVMNMAALGILVVTIFVNLCIQLSTQIISGHLHFVPISQILVLFVIMSFSTLYVPSTKKYIDLRYFEIHNTSFTEESNTIRISNVDKLRDDVRKYWMTAQTGSPQFVMARSVTCVASGAFCVLTTTLLLPLLVYLCPGKGRFIKVNSSYKWSILTILMIQIIGVVVGTIPCAFRLFIAIKLKWSGLRGKSFKTEFKIEKYWIEMLVEWKEKPLPLNIRSQKSKKLVHDMKSMFLCFCIIVQILIVIASKAIQLFFVFLIAPLLSCYHYCEQLKRKLKSNSSVSSNQSGLESSSCGKMDQNCYVLCLEGENELPERILRNICDEADCLIQMGRKQQPENLKELLKKSTNFNGVTEFDREEILSLDFYEPPNSWMLPLVTLTSIAIALPNITNRMVDVLLSSVSEGLIYTSLVEKDLNGKGDLVNIRNAAKVVWLGVEFYKKWLDQDLRKMTLEGKNSKGTLENLADIAKNSVLEFRKKSNAIQKENPIKWPVKAIAANTMYRISRTLLLDFELGKEKTDEELFENISNMISDILAACLTNLPRVITMKCFCSIAEKREEGVQQAAHLLGETEEILQILQQRELPGLNQDQATCIDEWRAIIKKEKASDSYSDNDTASSGSSEIDVVVE